MDEQFADELVANGDLTPDWRSSFLAVPRLQFIPDTVWHEVDGFFRPVRRTEDPDRWMELAAGKDSVVTQVDDGCPAGPGEFGDTPTSSASMPRMVALMLKYLDIRGGERVLEIGTGTGYNAALLAHRVGAQRVVTIEIDPEVAVQARKALADAGFGGVITTVGNGSMGHLAHAPYDRVIATASCHTVPYSWVAQTRPGGRIVTPWGGQYCNFGLLALTVHDNGTASGQIVDTAAFMRLRDQRFRSRPISPTDEDEEQASVTETQLHPADVRHTDHSRGAVIAIGTRVLNCRTSYTQPDDDPDGEGVLWVVDHDSDSWARLQHTPGSPGPYKVYQFGPRRLWDEVEAAHQWWVDQGEPGADRWRFTVTPDSQRIELD